jgi:amino-acid N-acetyltransferase
MLCPGEAAEGSSVTSLTVEGATAGDARSIIALLEAAGLPAAGLVDHLESAYVVRRNGRIIGTAALEWYAGGALLRSVAVDPAERDSGLGRVLTEHAIREAETRSVAAVYLLTTTADTYFARFGFTVVTRDEVPASLHASVQFQSACPASATVMRKMLR